MRSAPVPRRDLLVRLAWEDGCGADSGYVAAEVIKDHPPGWGETLVDSGTGEEVA